MAEGEETVPKAYIDEVSRDSAVPYSDPSSAGTSGPSSGSSSSSVPPHLLSTFGRDHGTIVSLRTANGNRRSDGSGDTTGELTGEDCGHAEVIEAQRRTIQSLERELLERNQEIQHLNREVTQKEDLVKLVNELKVNLEAAQVGREHDKKELENAQQEIEKLFAENRRLREIRQQTDNNIQFLTTENRRLNDKIRHANKPRTRTLTDPTETSLRYGRFQVETLSETTEPERAMEGVEVQPRTELAAAVATGAINTGEPMSAPACMENAGTVPAFVSICFQQQKRKRFSIEKSSALQCRACRRVFESREQTLLSKCCFHMHEPQPYSKWKVLNADGEGRPDERYWPCCKTFGKTAPPGCRTLAHHDISEPEDEHDP